MVVFFLLAFIFVGVVPGWADEIAVIVNANGPLVSLTESDVRAFYLGDRRFVGSLLVTPLHLPEGPTKSRFLSTVVGRTLKEYKVHWVQRVFQEGTDLPRMVADPAAMVAEVARHRNSIGYVPKHFVKGAPGVRALFVSPAP